MERIEDVIYDIKQIIREIRYDKSLTKYFWVLEDLERLLADIKAQKDAESDLHDL